MITEKIQIIVEKDDIEISKYARKEELKDIIDRMISLAYRLSEYHPEEVKRLLGSNYPKANVNFGRNILGIVSVFHKR